MNLEGGDLAEAFRVAGQAKAQASGGYACTEQGAMKSRHGAGSLSLHAGSRFFRPSLGDTDDHCVNLHRLDTQRGAILPVFQNPMFVRDKCAVREKAFAHETCSTKKR